MSKFTSVLITGASSGIGKEFAYQLAGSCQQMILVARREDLIRELISELRAFNPKLDLLYFIVDLTVVKERLKFTNMLKDNGASPDLVINNAGMGDYQNFADGDWEKLENMIQLNMTALTHITHILLPPMQLRRSGSIINVSSLASILPIPKFSVYAATKAYVTSFSEALRLEVEKDNVKVMALCPGPLKGLEENKPRVFPGWKVALSAVGISLLPMWAIRWVMSKQAK